MHILISNDDGYRAPGLKVLVDSLEKHGLLSVVAPEKNRSGASNSLTLDRPLRAHRGENDYYFVDGTPTDCVHLAVTGLLESEPDMVISGINAGANMGDDVIYSGTVAAAMEGRHLGLPSIAVSVDSSDPQHYATAAMAVENIITNLQSKAIPQNTILNINVPDIPWGEVKGFKATRLGSRHKSDGMIKQTDPRGDMMYWVGPPGVAQDAGEGTDFHAVEHHYISVTPLHIDLTQYDSLASLANLLN